jgi:septation ring formation regulator EzrA
MEHVFCNFVTSTQLLHNNFQKILFDVQQTSETAQSKLSKELEDTKESLETLMKEHEQTKTKLEKIRSDLGF